MSRSGYTEDCDNTWDLIRWRGAVASAIRGKRGQAFLKEILAAMDAMPVKRLARNVLVNDGYRGRYSDEIVIVGGDELVDKRGDVIAMGEVCAMGAFAKAKGLDTSGVDPEERDQVADLFSVSEALVAEIAYMNDECGWGNETPEARFERMRKWIAGQIRDDKATEAVANG